MVVQLKVADGIRIETPARKSVSALGQKAMAIVAYLALNENQSVSRERLAGVLWSESQEEQARASLRQSLKQLRTGFEQAGLQGLAMDRNNVWMEPGSISIDLQQALQAMTENRRQYAVADNLLNGERVAYGFESLDPAFASWLYVEREGWRRRFADGLENLIRSSGGDAETRRWAAEVLVDVDPSHETATHVLVRQFAAEGNVVAALRVYSRHWEILDSEFDMEPSDALQTLIAEVKLGKFDQAAPAAVEAPAPPPQSPPGGLVKENTQLPAICITGFTAWDQSSSNLIQFFRHDLIASLVKFREWVIVDADGDAYADALAGEQGINAYFITGSYMRSDQGHDLAITLMEGGSRRYVWSERFTLNSENHFKALSMIVRRMAAGINMQLSAALVDRKIRPDNVSQTTYELWARANQLIWNWDPAARAEAEHMFRDVMDRAPQFAPAYSGLASIYNTEHAIFPGNFPDSDRIEEAEALAKRSVELDPLDVRGRMALAWTSAMARKFEMADLQFDMAYELNPNNPTTLVSCANGKSLCGDKSGADSVARQALQITPLVVPFHWAYLVAVRFLSADYRGSVAAADQSGDLIPVVAGWRAAALGLAGEEGPARAAGQRYLELVRQKWCTDQMPDEETAVDWFLQNFPLRHAEDRLNVEKGLQRAGLSLPN